MRLIDCHFWERNIKLFLTGNNLIKFYEILVNITFSILELKTLNNNFNDKQKLI